MRWLDRLFIRLCQRFGEYRKDDPTSFRLAPLFPLSSINVPFTSIAIPFNFQLFPDETAFFRHILSVKLVHEFTFNDSANFDFLFSGRTTPAGSPGFLFNSSLMRFCCLDAFFQIVIFHGAHIAQWRNEKYHEKPGIFCFQGSSRGSSC